MRERLAAIASSKAVLPLILLLCLALRLGLAVTFGDADVEQDARILFQIAQHIADGDGFTLEGADSSGVWHPSAYGYVAYPYFLAIPIYAFDADLTHVMPVLIVQAFLDTLTCFLTFLIAIRVTGSRPAAVAATLLYAIYPPFLRSACNPFPETLATAFLAVAVLLLLRALRTGGWGYALAGAVMGLAVFARPSLLLFPLLMGLVMFIKRREIGGWVKKAAIYVLAAYLVISPWTVRNYRVFRAFVPVTTNMGMVLWGSTGPYDGKCLAPFYPMVMAGTEKPENALVAVVSKDTYARIEKLKARTDGLDERSRNVVLQKAAVQEIREHPLRFLALAVKKPFRLWFGLWGDFPISVYSYAMAVVNIVLMACGLLAFRRSTLDRHFRLVAASLLVYITLVSMGTCAGLRYSYPFMPYVLILATSLAFGRRKKLEPAGGAADQEAEG